HLIADSVCVTNNNPEHILKCRCSVSEPLCGIHSIVRKFSEANTPEQTGIAGDLENCFVSLQDNRELMLEHIGLRLASLRELTRPINLLAPKRVVDIKF